MVVVGIDTVMMVVHSGAGSFVASVDVQRCLCDADWCSDDNGVGKHVVQLHIYNVIVL